MEDKVHQIILTDAEGTVRITGFYPFNKKNPFSIPGTLSQKLSGATIRATNFLYKTYGIDPAMVMTDAKFDNMNINRIIVSVRNMQNRLTHEFFYINKASAK